MSFRRGGLIPLACLLLAAALASCGASGSSSSGSATATAPRPGAAATGATKAGSGTTASADGAKPAATSAGASPPAPAAANRSAAASDGAGAANPPPLTRASAHRAEARAEAHQGARHRALARQAGNAAPFLVPVGDNSIPTYGSEAPSSELAAATASLGAYLSARAAGEWSTACAEMAATVTKQLELLAGEAGGAKPSCADAYAKLSERVPASQRISPLSGGLTALRVEADKAFALFYGPHEQQYMMPMVSEGGAWKVNQIEPIPWPVGTPASSP